jgi:5-oxopent-3-ene-1,2,5-tricarboxylate decarboxylase / 2-hydroxyhepta-2,4-diene-1,7-dioate isomerase
MTDAPSADAATITARLTAVGTAGLSSALRKRGYLDVFVDGVRPLAAGMRFAGPARTLRLVPFRPDLFMERGGGFNPQKQAFDGIGEGEVLVIEARGLPETGTLGDILALRAHARGAAAVVTDGGVRDAVAVAAIGLPVFTQGPHPSVLGRRHVPWETDVVVACGGAAVVPGDVLVGDDDGLIVIPAALVGEVLVDAERQEAEDAWIAARVAEGAPVDGLFPMNVAWRARFEADAPILR